MLCKMTSFTLKNCQQKILVVGPIYNNIEKINKIKQIEDNYQHIIFNGSWFYPYENIEELEEKINLFNRDKWKYVISDLDLKLLLDTKITDKIKNWINNNPNIIILEFFNRKVIVTSGGLLPNMKKKDLDNNLEISFISNIDNENWHKLYGGAYGYVISNNPLTDKFPHFYNYSAQIGNYFNQHNNVYAQEVDQYGLKETILL